MRSPLRVNRAMRDVLTRYWPLWLVGGGYFIVALIFQSYLTAHQHVADDRAERQRKAICAILANIPGQIPPEIAKARIVFARVGHPGDCLPVVPPIPAVTVTPIVRPGPTSTVVVITPAPSSPPPRRSPPATRRPSPTPTATHSRTPAPSPSPSRSCLLILCR